MENLVLLVHLTFSTLITKLPLQDFDITAHTAHSFQEPIGLGAITMHLRSKGP